MFSGSQTNLTLAGAGAGAGARSGDALADPEAAGGCGPLKRPLNLLNMSTNLQVHLFASDSAESVKTPKELRDPAAMTAYSSTNALGQRTAPTTTSDI